MTQIRISEDYDGLRDCIRKLLRREKDFPEAYARWIEHLILCREMAEIWPGIGSAFTWGELRGLAILDAVIREQERTTRICPRCKARTSALYQCDKCGMRLQAA